MTTLRKAMPFTLFCAALLVCPLLAAQTQDCSFTYTFTGNATQTAVSNLSGNTPCVNWRVTLSTSGTQSATVTFQTSPDNSTWTAVPNTVCSSTVQPPCILQGTNPIVGTQGMMYTASYGSYVRVVVTLSSGTGTGTVRAYGAKGASASAGTGSGGGGGSGTVTSVGFTGGIVIVNTPTTTPALIIAGTSGGIPYFSSASTWASSGVLGLNRVVLGGGAGAAPTVTAADTTPTHALFATAGAPAFRAIALSDLPTIPGAVACPENPISMTIGNTYTCTDNLGVATGKFLWCQDPNSTPVNAGVQVSWAGATINTFTWVAAATETVNCYGSLGGGGGSGGGGLVLLETHTASNSASLSFTALSASYDEYTLEGLNLVPATNGADIYLLVSTDGGATWVTSASYDWSNWHHGQASPPGGYGLISGESDTKIVLCDNNQNTTGLSVTVKLFQPNVPDFTRTIYDSVYYPGLNQAYRIEGAGTFKSTTPVNALRLVFNAGSIVSGIARLYGMAK